MVIKIIHGNLLDSTDFIIAHSCNAQPGVFGAGVALAIKNKYPSCYKKYREVYETTGLKMGSVVWYHNSEHMIANCITQAEVGTHKRQVLYSALWESLEEVFELAQKMEEPSVSLPPISMGLAGGDPEIIMLMIDKISAKYDIDVKVFAFDKPTYELLKGLGYD